VGVPEAVTAQLPIPQRLQWRTKAVFTLALIAFFAAAHTPPAHSASVQVRCAWGSVTRKCSEPVKTCCVGLGGFAPLQWRITITGCKNPQPQTIYLLGITASGSRAIATRRGKQFRDQWVFVQTSSPPGTYEYEIAVPGCFVDDHAITLYAGQARTVVFYCGQVKRRFTTACPGVKPPSEPPRDPSKLKDAYKEYWEQASDDSNNLKHFFRWAGFPVAALCLPCGAAMEVDAELAEMQAEYEAKQGRDPPDPNFTRVTPVVLPAFTLSPAPPGAPGTIWQTFVTGATQSEQIVGVEHALLDAMQRAEGAARVHADAWERMQLSLVGSFATTLAGLLEGDPRARSNFADALRDSPNGEQFAAITMNSDTVLAVKQSVKAQGLSPSLASLLTRVGVQPSDVIAQIDALNPSDYTTSVTLFDRLESQHRGELEQQLAGAMNSLAKRIARLPQNRR